jgi:hypothetical protein
MAKQRVSKRAAPARPLTEVRAHAVEAEEFRLVDRSGRPRATLEMTALGPRLVMMHEDGTVALELLLSGDGSGLRLAGRDGETRVFVGASRGSARLGMADTGGSQRAFLGVSTRGQPALTLYDGDQRQVWTTRRS